LAHHLTKMQTQFKTLTQLLDFFKDEETCKKYYEFQRWGGNVACPHCGSLKVYRTNRGFKCGEKECYKKFSLTVGTIFENSKIPLRTWFAAMYLCTTSKKGISSVQLSEQLGITQKTAWFVLSRIRTMLADNSNEPLTGEVEVDETYVGGKDYFKHKSKKSKGTGMVEKSPMVGFKQRDGKIVLRVVDKGAANTATIAPLVRQHVCTSAILITDGFGAYRAVGKEYKAHEIVNHTAGEYVRGKFHTNNMEGFWAIMKRGIYGIYHSVSHKHLHRYCNEFSYRYNTREVSAVERFQASLQKVSDTRITYKGLIGK